MADWVVLTQTITANNDPREFANGEDRIHMIAAERVGGGSDARVPRRAMGTGPTRAAARRSLVATISRYDHRHRVVFPA